MKPPVFPDDDDETDDDDELYHEVGHLRAIGREEFGKRRRYDYQKERGDGKPKNDFPPDSEDFFSHEY